ncbi:MAG: glycosyltransferase family 2 protein, partial [Chloroflexota bacterium]
MISMQHTHPFVSVVTPTHNRCHQLSRTLAALSVQTYPADRMECLFVADGCVDDTVAFLQQYSAPWRLNVFEEPGVGPAAARNRGAAEASGEILIFLDDDMEVVPEFVAEHVAIHQKYPRAVVVGTLLAVPHQTNSYFERSLQEWWDAKFFRMRQPGYRFRYDDFLSGNLSVRADCFAQVGGFDPTLHCRDDYELGVRLLEAGVTCKLATGAASYHHDATDLARALQRRVPEGKADVYISLRHAGLHEQTPLAQAPYTLLGRILRYLAFRRTALGHGIAQICQHILPWLELLGLFGFWQSLLFHIQDYWYWYGVGTVAHPAVIREIFSTPYVES